MSLSKPILPPQLVREVESHPSMAGYGSFVYTDDCKDDRIKMRSWIKHLSPDDRLVVLSQPFLGFTKEARRRVLHFAVMDGDVLHVLELLRLGANVDIEDAGGLTPLYLALRQLVNEPIEYKSGHMSYIVKTDPGEGGLARIAWVVRILVEQHADVNRTINDVSCLLLACRARDWDIISLLLKHGAKPLPPSAYFSSKADVKRFASLVSSTEPNCVRPPRVCPCWSKKIVVDCHGKEEALYPLDFICICGSNKLYRRCCHNRKPVIEFWDEQAQKISHRFDMFSRGPAYIRNLYQEARVYGREAERTGEILPRGLENFHEFMSAMAVLLLAEGVLDRAFAYAMKNVDFIPKPMGRQYSRTLCENMQRRWNDTIDQYISQGIDNRSKREIEMVAKIGTWNGALIRGCEGVDCKKVEGRDVVILKICSKCQISVYCSPECQRSAWSNHKAVCCSDSQTEQPLPSQAAMVKYCQSWMDQFPNVSPEERRAMLLNIYRFNRDYQC